MDLRDDNELALGKGLFDVVRDWRSTLGRRLAPHGLSEATWRVLLHIDLQGGRATQAALADRIGVEPPTMVRLIDRMQRDGWVQRVADPQDRRINWIEPTSMGRKVTRKVVSTASELRRDVLGGLSPVDLELFLRLLGKVEAALAPLVSGPGSARPGQSVAPTRRLPRANSAAL